MLAGALATVPQVKTWLGIDLNSTTDDDLLQRLVSSASAFVLNYLSLETFAKSSHTEVYDGYGSTFMVLRQQPALSVAAVSFNGVPITEATGDGLNNPFTNGYKLFRQNLTLFGKCFPTGRSTVMVEYTSGYQIVEQHRIPATGPYTVAVNQTWLEDESVTIGGVALVAVDASPGDMEYTVADGVYTFNVGQANELVSITYSYVPDDVNQAVIELVGERYRYKDRIGYSSKSLGGQETVAFQSNNVPPFILNLLNKYIRVVPV